MKNLKILIVIFLVIIFWVIFLMFNTKNTSIKGLKANEILANSREVQSYTLKENDLNNNLKSSNNYIAYIINEGSEYDTIKGLNMEVKYPKMLKPYSYWSNGKHMFINWEYNKQLECNLKIDKYYNDKKYDINSYVSKKKEELNTENFKGYTFDYNIIENKFIIKGINKDANKELIYVCIFDGNYIYSLTSIINLNNESIVNTLEKSFKVYKKLKINT